MPAARARRSRRAAPPPGRARRTSRSRSSRVCRRLTVELRRRRRGRVHRPASTRTSSTCASATSRERWIRTKPASRQCSSRVVSGLRIRWLPVGGVQPGVVALRLDVADVGAGTNRVTPPSSTGMLSSSARDRRSPRRSHDPADRLGQPVVPHRLEHVVDGVELERVDGVVVVRGDEDDRRRCAEPGQHPGQLEPGQAGHPDVEEDRVDAAAPAAPAAPRRRSRGGDRADPRVAPEQVTPARRARAARRRRPGRSTGVMGALPGRTSAPGR